MDILASWVIGYIASGILFSFITWVIINKKEQYSEFTFSEKVKVFIFLTLSWPMYVIAIALS